VLRCAVRRQVALGGGASKVELDDGRTVVVKRAEESAIAAEAAGLRWLSVPGGPAVPAVLDEGAGLLVTEFVPAGSPSPAAAVELGRRLAALHASGAEAFGAGPPGGSQQAWIGRARMHNAPSRGPWAQWYAADRLLPYLRQARDGGELTAGEGGEVERVCARLPELAGPAEPPARLHGDLWSGNVLWSADGAWLIDPAAHGGHRETDLAMLALFGCPQLPQVLDGYQEATPLAAGWPARVPLHQLFPLLVHVVLFGRGYTGQLMATARSALRAAG
jgi:fructosamine-3-kinase